MRFALVLALGVSAAWAQQAGKITGTVTDATGAAVPDVTVEAKSVETGAPRAAVSNASGVYVIAPLPVGSYSLEARKEGFKAISRSGLRIDINSTLTLDLHLEVGNVSERVTVEAAAPTIETESQAIGNSRYQVQLRNLPIIVREVQALVGQTAGVPYGTTDTVGGNVAQGGRSAMQVLADGAQLNPLQTTAWPAIDGIGRRADLTVPGVDSIAEVKWITNGGSAEYAQPTQVIVASKSGTNEIARQPLRILPVRRHGGAALGGAPTANRSCATSSAAPWADAIKKDKMFFFGGVGRVPPHLRGGHERALSDGGRTGRQSRHAARPHGRARRAGPGAPQRPADRPAVPGQRHSGQPHQPGRHRVAEVDSGSAAAGGRITDFNAVFFKPLFDNSEKYDVRYDYEPQRERPRVRPHHASPTWTRPRGSAAACPGTYGYTTKNEWTHAAASKLDPHVEPVHRSRPFQFTFRSMPFKNIPSGGDTTFPVKINDVNPKPPFARPAGDSDRHQRPGDQRPVRPAAVQLQRGLRLHVRPHHHQDHWQPQHQERVHLPARLQDAGTGLAALRPLHHGVGLQQRAIHHFGHRRRVRRFPAGAAPAAPT